MRFLNAIVFICVAVNHMYFLSIVAQRINGQCRRIFEEHNNTTAFGNYCEKLAFSNARIAPNHYRRYICLRKCQESETCVYFNYDPASSEGAIPRPSNGE